MYENITIILLTLYLSLYLLAIVRGIVQYLVAIALKIPAVDLFIGSPFNYLSYVKIRDIDVHFNIIPFKVQMDLEEDDFDNMRLSKKIFYLLSDPVTSMLFGIIVPFGALCLVGISIVDSLIISMKISTAIPLALLSIPDAFSLSDIMPSPHIIAQTIQALGNDIQDDTLTIGQIIINFIAMTGIFGFGMGLMDLLSGDKGREIIMEISKKAFSKNERAISVIRIASYIINILIAVLITYNAAYLLLHFEV